jgi:hypothetical protein
MAAVLLVSEVKIKAFSEVNDNLDVALLLPNIQIAQDLGLQNMLGTAFYQHILNAAQTSTLTAQETILLDDYIQAFLLWRAVYEALPSIYMRMMNKSVIIGDTPNGKAVDAGSLQYLRNIHQNRYEFYAQRMMDYLRNNPSYFQLYYSWSSTDGMPPSRENYFSGIHIQNGRRRLPRWNGLRGYADPTGDNCCSDYDGRSY